MTSRHISTLAVLDQAQDAFGAILGGVSHASCAAATPCEEWDVGQLVDHVAGAALIYTALLDGKSFNEAMSAGRPPLSIAHRRTYYVNTAAQLRAALARPGAMAVKCDVPGGPIAGSGLATVRIFDVTVHCWDLARAIGAPERLSDTMVDHALRYAIKHYGEEAAAAARAEASQHQDMSSDLVTLLQISGRSP